MSDGVIKVLVVDHHDVVRSGLTGLLSAEIGIEVVGRAEDRPWSTQRSGCARTWRSSTSSCQDRTRPGVHHAA
ncbi:MULTISPECIES: hypothetical protein [Streptomyces]|uniref:hypothetical protein n=1 Tax=Streptomyces TaxID=1883 RepID=UPI0004C14197|nr:MULTISPECIES: hypothetical protein [Streptomyces]KOG81189.1 hypothetical protein ADK33_15360 [Streptomyces griseus subsp. rhodochrous]KOU07443.1 hypothetical protein ADK88_10575 [Streptomyces sp. NRRL F-2295]KOU49718.1 hypothetical protein ADK56_17160 [Streptomyces sp. MMG1522]